MNEVKIFENPEFGQVRSVMIDSEPWFVGKDVAAALGYRDTVNALKNHVDNEDKIMGCQNTTPSIMDSKGRIQYPTWIDESGVYSLILSSKLPNAKQFKHWVTSEVLPSIRKHGLYAVDELLNNPKFAIKAFTALKEEREKRAIAERKITEQKEIISDQQETIKQKSIDNKALSGKLLDWADRDRISAGIRKLASATGISKAISIGA